MQKPVGPPVGHGQDPSRGTQDPDFRAVRETRHGSLEVGRPERIAVPRSPVPVVRRHDGGHGREQRVGVHEPGVDRRTGPFERLEREGVGDVEPARPGPPQRLEMRAAPQPLADVMGQGPDIEARAARHAKTEQRGVGAARREQHFKFPYRDFNRLELHRLVPPRLLVGPFSPTFLAEKGGGS